jgi:predicted transcriptional regulator
MNKPPPKRTRTANRPKSEWIKARVPAEVKDAVTRLAIDLDETESFVVREAIRNYFIRQKTR